jgi:hypothetical protein
MRRHFVSAIARVKAFDATATLLPDKAFDKGAPIG